MTYFITNREGTTIKNNIVNKESAISQAKKLYKSDDGVAIGRYGSNKRYTLLPLVYYI